FVKQSGGHIKIYSEPGEGTTVKLYLPRSKAAAQWASPTLVTPAQGSGETVLVVEDDDSVRAAVTDMLNELGYSVLRAETAENALAILENGATADVLFTDVVMPGAINTRELARRAKQLLPGIQVLFTSGYTQNAIVHNGRLDEGVELLSKPYRKDELARKLRGMLDGVKRSGGEAAIMVKPMPHENPPAARATRGKVLIVEDSTLIRMTMVDMIEEIGLPYAEAANGQEALAHIESDPEINILMTDLGLPGISGEQLVQQAKKIRPELRVIVASGYSEVPSADGGPAGAAYLQKPFTLDQLRAALGES
ncbi:MAG TPA: response regulator, partial [Bryobacteraceae bacterium]